MFLPFFLFLLALSFPIRSVCPFLSASEIYVSREWEKRKRQRWSRSPCLERINSAVSVGNCFKESAFADAIIHEGWRNHQCNIELSFQWLSEDLKIRSAYEHTSGHGAGSPWALLLLQKLSSLPAPASYSRLDFHPIDGRGGKLSCHRPPRRSCSWRSSAATLTAGLDEKHVASAFSNTACLFPQWRVVP